MTPKTYDNHMCVRQTDKDNNSAEKNELENKTSFHILKGQALTISS